MQRIVAGRAITRHQVLLAVAIMGALLIAVAAAPAAADPPASSGVVQRFVAQDFVAFPDFEHGLAVFVNVSRDDLCDASGGPQADWNVLLVTSPSSAELMRVQAPEMPIYLYRFTGAPEGPCVEEIEDDPALTGTVDAVINDNELCPCQNNRTNSFGDRGVGTVYDGAGSAWHYSWNWRALIDQEDMFRVASEKYVLHPVGG